MSNEYIDEKNIAKEITLAIIAKLNVPFVQAGIQDHEKFANTVSQVYEIIYEQVKK